MRPVTINIFWVGRYVGCTSKPTVAQVHSFRQLPQDPTRSSVSINLAIYVLRIPPLILISQQSHCLKRIPIIDDVMLKYNLPTNFLLFLNRKYGISLRYRFRYHIISLLVSEGNSTLICVTCSYGQMTLKQNTVKSLTVLSLARSLSNLLNKATLKAQFILSTLKRNRDIFTEYGFMLN